MLNTETFASMLKVLFFGLDSFGLDDFLNSMAFDPTADQRGLPLTLQPC